MKTALLALWLAAPVVWASWHFGPGQDYQKRDASDAALAQAKKAADDGDYAAALKQYDDALARLPRTDRAQARRIRLAQCRLLLSGGKLPEAHDRLVSLLDELDKDPNAETEVANSAREAVAGAKYYLTWLMRLEGYTRDIWEPEIESARQHFRHLAETGGSAADTERWQNGLESAIRLSRMDLTELQGLPLPSECEGCKSGRGSRPGNKPPKNKKPSDSREAGSGPPADGEGN